MIKRLVLRSILFVVVLAMSLLCAVTILIATEPGTRWLLTKVREATGAELTHVQGALLRGVQLKDIRYHTEALQLDVQQLDIAWHPVGVLWGVLIVDQLYVDGAKVNIPISESAPANDTEFQWPDLGVPVSLVASDVSLNGIQVNYGEEGYSLDNIKAGLTYGPRSLTIDKLDLATAGQTLSLQGQASLSYPYSLELSAAAHMRVSEQTPAATDVTRFVPEVLYRNELQAELEAHGNIAQLEFTLATTLPAEIEAQGQWKTGVENAPDLQATLTAPVQPVAAYWADVAAVEDMQAGGELTVNGWLDDYRAQFNGQYTLVGYPAVDVQLDGEGNLQGIVLPKIELAADPMQLSGSGNVQWQELVAWALEAEVEQLNPALVLEGWPGQINGSFSTSGRWQNSELSLDASIKRLSGSLRGLAVQGSGAASLAQERLQLTSVQLSLGGNLLQVNGHIGDTFGLDWNLRAPLLEQIDPRIGGQLDASGHLGGSRQSPQLEGGATAVDLHWGDNRIEQLALESQVTDLQRQALSLQAEAQGLELAGSRYQSANVSFTGSPSEHQLTASLLQDQFAHGETQISGGWDGQQWQGQLRQLSITTPYVRPMELKSPVAVTAAAERVTVSDFCLLTRRQQTGEVQSSACVTGKWQQGQGAAGELAVERLPLNLLRRWLKEEVDVEGYLQGQGKFSWAEGGVPKLNADFSAVGGAFIYRLNDTESDRYPLDEFGLHIQQQDTRLTATAELAFTDYGSVNAELLAQMDSKHLQGEVLAQMQSISPLEALLPAVRDIEGRLDARAQISGTFSDPQLVVDASVSGAAFEAPSLGVSFTQLNATVQGNQDDLTAEVNTRAGEDGSLSLQAKAEQLLEPQWQVQASLTGDYAHVMDSELLNLYFTPDLQLQASAERIDVSGRALVPEAHAVINTLPVSATKVSDDVVVIDAEDPQNQGNIPVYVNVEFALGDKVSFDAAGFKARLGGELSIDKSPERALFALGNINIIDGRFQAYGQDLTIEKGTLSFQGPMDNPGLNVTATREVEEVEVGLIIGGTLQNPTSEIFSRPQQTESDAMSMLFTGKPISGASSGEASMLVNAIAKLGIKRGQFVADDIAGRFGLDELTIKSDDDVKDSSLWLGKYLTEDLYVHYAIGLFDSISTVGLTYFISDNLRLEAESGEVQSADLIFRMQR
ncbi:translocation/assembly module TamB domain-containing protein [Gilvimarinus sp. DA14]|uniref:translocation/assembly module TamB domain-containing protein n=1 Tax=Gilvimarinus sp. DA14 TaxID=2956798 RepID=UPI0020B71CB2|nr:translocation/assembly module TamB domain-containing protein [Gilvimarinus sp. DA14]UTF59530.1 translocation/assembly module TamB domain-containing protein [Gilvimarinus sp. DA14]